MNASFSQLAEHLQQELRRLKKAKARSQSYLHSGEHAVMNFIPIMTKESGVKPNLLTMCQALGVTQATMTQVVNRLMKKGLLCKESSPADKRSKLLSLTPAGEDALRLQQKMEQGKLIALLQHLGDEDAAHLLRILSRTNDFLTAKPKKT